MATSCVHGHREAKTNSPRPKMYPAPVKSQRWRGLDQTWLPHHAMKLGVDDKHIIVEGGIPPLGEGD